MPLSLRLALPGSLVLAMALVGCGSSTDTGHRGAASPGSDVAGVSTSWRSKCAGCHAPVEPGTRSREVVEGALDRHKKRVRLSEVEWSAMVDFLARPSASSQAKTEPTPSL